jgi:hypothetical protein
MQLCQAEGAAPNPVHFDEDLTAVTDGFVEGSKNAAAKKCGEKLRSRAVQSATDGAV